MSALCYLESHEIFQQKIFAPFPIGCRWKNQKKIAKICGSTSQWPQRVDQVDQIDVAPATHSLATQEFLDGIVDPRLQMKGESLLGSLFEPEAC